MTFYTDPVTGERRQIDVPRQRSDGSFMFGWIIALALLIGIATWTYHQMQAPADVTNTGASTVTEPVTTPSSPNASPTHPAPSPNPGP